jgi:transcriptional regulator with XRE-family HTH domain
MMAEEPVKELRSKNLGSLLRQARTQAGQSRVSCANLLNVPSQAITDFESGKTDIAVTQLEALADFLDVPPVYFWITEVPSDESGEEETEQPDIVQERMWLRQKLVGVLLRQARLAAGKTQKECAEELGVSHQHISEYEYGRRDIPVVELEDLVEFLEVPVETFLEHEIEQERLDPVSETFPPTSPPVADSLAVLSHLPPELRELVTNPVNSLYLNLALKLSRMPVATLREIGENILEVTY